MKTKRNGWMAAGLAALVAVAATQALGFTRGERQTARIAADEARGRLAGAAALAGKAVTLLPVHGDEDAYFETALLDAAIQAGVNMVVANDTQDARFKRILKEIRWDEEQKRLETVDPSTIDELGRLLSTQVLLEGRLSKGRLPVPADRKGRAVGFPGADGQGRVELEVQLLAYEIATKRYVWSAILTVLEPEPPQPANPDRQGGPAPFDQGHVAEVQIPLNVGVKVVAEKGAEMEADLLETWAHGRLADLGYRPGSGEKDDLVLTLRAGCEEFDRTGNYVVYDGSVKAVLAVKAGTPRELGATSIPARGKRGLGETQAHRNLAEEMEGQLGPWLKRELDADMVDFAAVRVRLVLADPIEMAGDFKAIDRFQKAFMDLDGVRSARLESQDNAAGVLEFDVAYERSKLPTGVVNALFAAHPELLKHLK